VIAPARLTLDEDGAAHFGGAALSVLDDLEQVIAAVPLGRAGVRLYGLPGLAPLLVADGPVGAIAATALHGDCRPVRAILFDKTPDANWTLGWHQDRTIAVRERREVPGFGPWTRKQGLIHVEPPFGMIESMVTIRLHLDPVPADNAPLLIAPGSHRLGRIPEAEMDRVVQDCGTAICLAERGDIWLYATPVVHASGASRTTGSRRVLQIDYAAGPLPGGLAWLGL
jgi:ectoine hydroxylase-related dioxygenase (phytanoyl-CoA dioxygenase family)